MAGTTLPTPLYPIYQERFGFGDLLITVIFATYAVGLIIGLILTGRLSDEIGRRKVLMFGLACAIGSTSLFLVAHGVAPILVARLLSGLTAGAFAGTATAMMLDLAPGGRRDIAAGTAVAVNLGGLGCGALLSGALAQTGTDPLRLSYWVYLALLVPAVLAVVLAPETVTPSEHPRFAPQRLSLPPEVRGTFVRAALSGVSAFVISGLFGAVSPLFLGQYLDLHSHLLAGSLVFILFLTSVTDSGGPAGRGVGRLLRGALPGTGGADRVRRPVVAGDRAAARGRGDQRSGDRTRHRGRAKPCRSRARAGQRWRFLTTLKESVFVFDLLPAASVAVTVTR